MGVNTPKKHIASKSPIKWRAAVISAALAAFAVSQQNFAACFDKRPKNNSKLTGKEWLDELLAGHPKHFYNAMGMNKHVFKNLLAEIIQAGHHDTCYVPADE
jgi:hypothetical protein